MSSPRSAPGVQFSAEGACVSSGDQALFSQHQVSAGQQQLCCVSRPRRETLFPHLHASAPCRLSAHQALLQLAGNATLQNDSSNQSNALINIKTNETEQVLHNAGFFAYPDN